MNCFDENQDDATLEQAPPRSLRSRRWVMAALIAGSAVAAVGGGARIATAAQAARPTTVATMAPWTRRRRTGIAAKWSTASSPTARRSKRRGSRR